MDFYSKQLIVNEQVRVGIVLSRGQERPHYYFMVKTESLFHFAIGWAQLWKPTSESKCLVCP